MKYQINIIFNNTNKNIVLENNIINRDKILDLIGKLEINDKYKIDNYLIYNGTILSNNESFKIENNDIIFCNSKLKGGVIDIIINVLTTMAEFVKTAIPLIEDVTMLFVKFIEVLPLIFSPDKFINQIMYGITNGIKLIFEKFLNSIDTDGLKSNGQGYTGPFGVSEEESTKNRVICTPPTLMNIIFMILCPPFALFLHKGLKGIMPVILCSLMTYFLYYFPGFIYAALHILC